MTYRIATADAWKIFLALVATALLMVILMPFDNLGFVLAATGLFGWLYSVTVELAKANGMATQRVTNISVLGVVCSFIFAYAGYFPFADGSRYGVFLVVLSGLAVLGCMGYVVLRIGSLLARLEASASAEPKTSAALLVWLWPFGVWSLQPRLQQALRNHEKT